MKTKQPFILTAHIPDNDLGPYESLRQLHFPPERNFLRAHLTMFHRLPGENLDKITAIIAEISARHRPISAQVTALRHLGAGVAFTVFDADLLQVHAAMKTAFSPWLGGQDLQKWQPHITVQNKVSKSAADTLFMKLKAEFRPSLIPITGVDLWRYMDGPWQHHALLHFTGSPASPESNR